MFGKKIKTIVQIEGMSCIHCTNKVKDTLMNIDSVKNVKVDLSKKEAIILSNNKLNKDTIKKLIEDLDYKIIDILEE